MSASSFDESSNLVIEVTSPSDKNDGHFECGNDLPDSDLRDKSAKSGFFKKKRSKSPFKSPLKSPIKSPLKSPFKTKSSKASKSLKSPTEELLSGEDIKDIEQKIKEKDSDEWKVFQQMQERIKENVLKTQTSLSKFTNDGTEEHADTTKSEAVVKPKRRAPDIPKWSTSSYDDESSLIKEKNDSNGVEEDLVFKERATMNELDELHLNVTPVPSPRGTPKPPANSLRTSMENLDEACGPSAEVSQTMDADLLGLSLDNENSNMVESSQTNAEEYINQDLMGLDNFISSTDSQQGSSLHSSFDGSDMMFGSSVHSSARTTPLGFDDPELFPMEINQTSTLTSSFVSEMVNEFLQLDTMKEASISNASLNPFDVKSAKSNDTGDLSSFDPFAPIQPANALQSKSSDRTLDTSAQPDNPPQSKMEGFDPFGEIDEADDGVEGATGLTDGSPGPALYDPFDGRKHNTLGRGCLSHVYDNFGFGLADARQNNTETSDTNNEGERVYFDDNKNEVVASESNPFVSQNRGPTADSGFEGSGNLFDEDFLDTKSKGLNTSAVSESVWGMDDVTKSAPETEFSSKNPFQDDIFSMETFTNLESSEVRSDEDRKQLNPFLSEDVESSSVPLNKNMFLDIENGSEDKAPSSQSDVDLFLAEPVGAKPKEDIISPTVDDLDPFKPSKVDTSDVNTTAKSKSSKGNMLLQLDDDFDEDNDDEDDTFKLKIKPVMSDQSAAMRIADLPTAPPLKPPPVAPRSPQPPRENPFNRESPPEEDFAKFEVMHESDKDKDKDMEEAKNDIVLEKVPSITSKEKSSSISTTETTTPEEELNLEPLEPFYPLSDKQVWKLMLRQPTKKKLTTNRYWKNVFVKILQQNEGPVLKLFSDEICKESVQELPLQPCYSISDISLQHYDQYGKIHTVKMQYIFYRERVGLKAERLTPSFVKKPKATMILDHAPQVSELMKFGCLDKSEMQSFVREVEDALMNLEAHREKTLTYVKEEVCAEVWDEYMAELDKTGKVLTQKARCRVFFLAFVTGMPTCELGLNDKRRRGREVVGRHDIIPIKTEEWIRIEDPVFHCCIDKKEFEKSNNLRFHPLDGCQVELVRYRVRLRENKELPLQLNIQQIMRDSRCEIRCDLLVTGYHSFSKKHGQFPCENIEVHFPIPESWIYLFRYEKRFGYGSFKSATRKPGKIKGLERLTMMAQGLLSPTLMEADVGVAKYENVYKAVVWRIPRLPERNEGAYKSHLFRMMLDFSAHDDIPETFEKYTTVDFTMPSCTVSQSQVRSVSVENPNPPEKWVRYIAKYHYRIEIEHIDERTKKPEETKVESADEDSD